MVQIKKEMSNVLNCQPTFKRNDPDDDNDDDDVDNDGVFLPRACFLIRLFSR